MGADVNRALTRKQLARLIDIRYHVDTYACELTLLGAQMGKLGHRLLEIQLYQCSNYLSTARNRLADAILEASADRDP